MEPEGSLPHWQVPATWPYPESHRSNVCPHIPFPKDPSSYYPPIYAWVFQVVLFPSSFPTHTCAHLYSPLYALHDPPISFFSIWSPEQYLMRVGSLSSSLCSFLHSPVTSSLLGPSILLNTLFSNTLSLRSSVNVIDQVSHPHRQQAQL